MKLRDNILIILISGSGVKCKLYISSHYWMYWKIGNVVSIVGTIPHCNVCNKKIGDRQTDRINY